MKNLFKVVAFLEGVSYLLLMSLGLYYKYTLDNEFYVKLLGMPHGILFVTYIILAIFLRKKQNWNKKDFIIIMFASLIPFGTFYIDIKYLKK